MAGVWRQRRLPVLAAALALLTIVAFWPVYRNGFVVYDDERYITRNSVVLRGLTITGVTYAITRSYASNWHPLTWISHMADVQLFGLNPCGHHLMSLAIHTAGALLLLAVLQVMTGHTGLAFAVAALFAVHPLHVESVAWAAERKDVLSGFLFMAALLAWTRYTRRPGRHRYVLAVIIFTLACTAKPMVVTFPAVLLFLDWWPLDRMRGIGAPRDAGLLLRSIPALFVEKLPFAAISLLVGLLTMKAQQTAIVPLDVIPVTERVANTILSAIRYLSLVAAPGHIALFSPYLPRKITEPAVLAAATIIFGVSIAALLLHRRLPWLLAGWGWYLVMLIPVVGIVQVGGQAMAARYTYLPVVGIFISLVWGMDRATGIRRVLRSVLPAVFALVIVLLGAMTRRDVAIWRTGETHSRRMIADAPGSPVGWWNLGAFLIDAGRFREALEPLQRARDLAPKSSRASFNLGLAYENLGEFEAALTVYRETVRLAPKNWEAWLRLGLTAARTAHWEDAAVAFTSAVSGSPQNPTIHFLRGEALLRAGWPREAEDALNTALSLDSGLVPARELLEEARTR